MPFSLLSWKVSNRIRKLIEELGIAFVNLGQPWMLASVPKSSSAGGLTSSDRSRRKAV